ncbi:MAG: hypothetical protein ACO2ZG_08535 [Flavobacteriaceae bacterium]
MRSLLRFYVQSSLHVGFAVVALTKITAHYREISLANSFWLGVFCLTVFGYNLIKNSPLWWKKPLWPLDRLKVMSLLALAVAVVLLFPSDPWQWMVLLSIALLSGFYTFPLRANHKNFRDRHGLKIYMVAAAWTLVSVFLPVVYSGDAFEYSLIYLLFSRLLFVLVATLPFELRDLHADAVHLATWPQKYGIKGTKIRGTMALMGFVGIEYKLVPDLDYFFLSLLMAVILVAFLWKSRTKQSEFYSSFWVESLPIVWWLLIEFFTLSTI